MISSDLTTLFTAAQPGVRFRQGTILTWNASNGNNTVDLAGGTLTNVGMMNIGEAISLKPGHVVGLLGQGSTWFIIGRITLPGSADFASASVAFGGAGTSATNFSVTTSNVAKVTSSIAVPSWADEALVLLTVNSSISNSSASTFYVLQRALIDGIAGGDTQFGLNATGDINNVNGAACSAQRLIVSPGATISLAGNIWNTGGTIPAAGATIANLDAIAVFRSTT